MEIDIYDIIPKVHIKVVDERNFEEKYNIDLDEALEVNNIIKQHK